MDLKTVLYNISNQPRCCVYVAIGSAAHMKKQNGAFWSIDPQYEQQFPRFLRTLKTECPFDPLHIILIDPLLENPPFIACNEPQRLADNWTKVDEDVYYENVCNITVYALRSHVSYGGGMQHAINGMIDITECLRLLNTLAIQHRWFVVVQDYSGNNIAESIVSCDPELKGHHDHIIYGLNSQYDGGCYLDISQPNCDFVYKIDEIQIKAIILTDGRMTTFIDEMQELESSGDQRYLILRDQRDTYLRVKHELFTKILAFLRAIYNIMQGKHQPYIYPLPEILKRKYIDIMQDMNELPATRQCEIVYHIIRSELYNVGLDSNTIDELIHQMRLSDMYKWIDIINLAFQTM